MSFTEYVELCGYKNGELGNGRKKVSHNGNPTRLSLDEIAVHLGTSKRDLQRALSIERNLTPAMKDLLDTGVITKMLLRGGKASMQQKGLIHKTIHSN